MKHVPSVIAFMVAMMGGVGAACVTDAGDDATSVSGAPTVDPGQLQPPALVAGDRAKDARPREQSIGATNTEWPMWPHGGGGGVFTGHATPPGVIFAVRVSSGQYVDSLSLAWYQPGRWDNHYASGDPMGSVTFGGSGGGDNGWWYCPAGQGVIGLRGNAGGLVDRFGVICGDVTYPNPDSPYNTFSPLWGGGGGWWFGDDKCPTGRLVDSFNVRSGSLLDFVQGICVNAH
jgi:hypothetical protein